MTRLPPAASPFHTTHAEDVYHEGTCIGVVWHEVKMATGMNWWNSNNGRKYFWGLPTREAAVQQLLDAHNEANK